MRRVITKSAWNLGKSLGHFAAAKLLGQSRKHCPVCGYWLAGFEPFGTTPRENAKCGHCGALERHRLVWLYFQRKTNLFDGQRKSVLHLAPEPCFERRLRRRFKGQYITADLHNPNVTVKMDVSAIPYPDQSFDVFYASHVFEYVPDDQRAFREILRILKPGGWAVILILVKADATRDISDLTLTERRRLYGEEWVRLYGPDYCRRLSGAGFNVSVAKALDLVPEPEAVRLGLTAASGEVAFCAKPNGN